MSCSKKENKIDPVQYQNEIQKWQKERVERLKQEDGWLTLCGLFWLQEGENTMGDDSANVVVFPRGKSPKVAGSIFLEKGSLRLKAKPDAGIKYHDSIVTSMTIQSDGEGMSEPTILTLQSLTFYVIKRGDQLGVRVKDKENPSRLNFKGLEYFPIDLKWRVEAKYEPYTPPKLIPISTKIGTVVQDSCPGALVFEVNGTACRLDAVVESGDAKELFIMFTDETSGKETYGNGRQLYTELPDSNGIVILDFNKALNWPCIFTEYATCPIPPRQNHLPVRIEAGEKMYGEH